MGTGVINSRRTMWIKLVQMKFCSPIRYTLYEFDQRIQEAELDHLTHSRATSTALAENYVGLPVGLNVEQPRLSSMRPLADRCSTRCQPVSSLCR
ncbi:hypothetical protein F4V89_19935 [Neorhizobium galegae]|nr:hypothetical protein F4V88_25315 [Neorhizobium galegae]KAB1111762.1 hypothetical protein F4V89_19935 [Neorhizobium galegae]